MILRMNVIYTDEEDQKRFGVLCMNFIGRTENSEEVVYSGMNTIWLERRKLTHERKPNGE